MLKRRLGFTIIELMVVISIIGILSTLVTINVAGAKQRANYTKVLTDMDSIADAAKLYHEEFKAWPADIDRNLPPVEPVFAQYLSSWPKTPCSKYQYDWDEWTVQAGTGNDYVGVTVKNSNMTIAHIYYFYDVKNFSGPIGALNSPTNTQLTGVTPSAANIQSASATGNSVKCP